VHASPNCNAHANGGHFAYWGDMALDKKERLAGAAAFQKMRELLRHFPIAVLFTVEDGVATARPLGIASNPDEFTGSVWFITDSRSRKVQAISRGASVSLVCENHEKGAYLYLMGSAAVVEDRERLRELYTPVQRTWFPDGPDDPHITLIRFDGEHADYWDGHASSARLALAFLKATVTGTPGVSGNAGTMNLK